MFANTSRGEALVRHLITDPELSHVEIRLLPADRSAAFGLSGPASGAMLSNLTRPMQQAPGPIRRARRVRMPNGAALLVDGAPAGVDHVVSAGARS